MTIVHQILSPSEAQRLTQRIKLTASSIRDSMFKLKNLVEEAKASNAWQVLGFRSWTEYLADTLGSEPMRLGRDERQELVEYLSGEGMSTRAIAPIVGVAHKTVARDLEAAVSFDTPAPVESSPEVDSPAAVLADPLTGEVIATEMVDATDEEFDHALAQARSDGDLSQANVVSHIAQHEPRAVTGLDGKTYSTPAPQQRRSSLVDDARNAGWQLRKAVERVQRIRDDDRFNKNKAEILAALQPHLDLALEVISDL